MIGFSRLLTLIPTYHRTACLNQYFQRVMETGMRNRASLIGMIYSKALVLSNDERGGKSTGDIVNLMST
jgi:ATP-binding cassette, subfamily C (CFTR/MRP), member 1